MEKRMHKLIVELKNDNILSKTIFKYHKIDKFLVLLLKNSAIWFSNPLSFNDPFDCNLTIDANNSPEQIKKYFQLANWKKLKHSDSNVDKLINSNFSDKEAFKRKLNSTKRKIMDNLGVACFTTNNDNLLMWAHYTQEHKGVVLEFDHSKDIDFFKPLKLINYINEYPKYNYYNARKKVVEKLILNKSNHWKYENEIRLLKHKVGLAEFKSLSLKAIYFGVRTSEKQINTIKTCINENRQKYNHVKLYKGKIDETDYKINFEKIT